MTTILITGMSGVGKSTLIVELARGGYRAVDLDDVAWSVEVPAPDGAGTEQLWREDRVAELLARADAPDVVSGCASNQGRFYDRFGAVVLLSVAVDVLRERLAARTTNAFGKAPHELERVLRDLGEVEPILRAGSTIEIDGSRPLEQVVAAVAELLPSPDRGSL